MASLELSYSGDMTWLSGPRQGRAVVGPWSLRWYNVQLGEAQPGAGPGRANAAAEAQVGPAWPAWPQAGQVGQGFTAVDTSLSVLTTPRRISALHGPSGGRSTDSTDSVFTVRALRRRHAVAARCAQTYCH